MSADALFFLPSNMRVTPEMRNAYVDGDLYHVCERVKEISPDLFIVPLDDGSPYRFGVGGMCEDGVERLIIKVPELDARCLDRLRKIWALPLDLRVRRMEAEAKKREQEMREHELEDLYERVGRPMWTDLERCGFIGPRPVSYPKLGVAARGKRAR